MNAQHAKEKVTQKRTVPFSLPTKNPSCPNASTHSASICGLVFSQQSRSEIVNLEDFTNWATHASPLQRSIEPQCAWAAPSAPVPFRYRASSSSSPIIWKICGSICGSLSWLRHAWQSEAVLPLASRDTTTELLRVLLYPKFRPTDDGREDLLADYLPWCETVIVSEPPSVPDCRDRFQQPFLELALVVHFRVITPGRAIFPLSFRQGKVQCGEGQVLPTGQFQADGLVEGEIAIPGPGKCSFEV